MAKLNEKDTKSLELYEKMLFQAKSAKKQKAINLFQEKVDRLKYKEKEKEKIIIDYNLWRI